MTIPSPAYTKVRCPNCQGLGNISFQDGFRYWLPESYWCCESCGYVGSTEAFQEASRMVLVRPEQVIQK